MATQLLDANGNIINPAKEDGNLASIKTNTDKIPASPSTINDTYPAGTGSNSTVTLTLANTAYSVPATASTKNHILVLYNGSDTDMYWGYATLTTGGILLPSGATTSVDLGANQTMFVYCTSAGKVINYTYKEVN